MDLESFMKGAVPGDFTLDQMSAFLMTFPEIRTLITLSKYSDKVMIRYLILQPDGGYSEASGSMKLEDFRKLVNQGKAYISLDDKDGGLPEDILPVKPLVNA